VGAVVVVGIEVEIAPIDIVTPWILKETARVAARQRGAQISIFIVELFDH
jgi:hypothetical protein